jgi:co-chaperonin GroES (HSP10)
MVVPENADISRQVMHVIGDRVIVKTEDQSVHMRDSGVIAVEYAHPNVVGIIEACPNGGDVHIGDVVIFPPSAGLDLIWNREHYLVLESDELLAVYEGESA